ncbi:MAG: DUF4230 domain-containing protein [Ferruginibacter sp.]
MIRLIYRLIKKPLLLLLALILFIFLLNRLNVFKGLFTSKSLLIDNTPLVIKEIKTIAELNTAALFQEVVVDSTAPAAVVFAAKREIVLIIKGKVTAGIDLIKLEDKNVFVKDDSVYIQLPAAVIRDVIINPSGIETFYEFGKWSNEEITLLKISARNKLIAEAGRLNLLEKADSKARFVIEQFLKAAGFKKIVVWTR